RHRAAGARGPALQRPAAAPAARGRRAGRGPVAAGPARSPAARGFATLSVRKKPAARSRGIASGKGVAMKTVLQLLQAKGRDVYAIGQEARVYDALKLMAEKDVGALVVLDGQRVVGIISERDYARKVILLGRSSHDIPVRDIMTSKVITVH